MTWTSTKPTQGGWYFYRESGKNMDKPMVAWVFRQAPLVFVTLCPMHDMQKVMLTTLVMEHPGEWWGPIKVPE